MHIYKTLPTLERERQLSIWHKALRVTWSPEDLSWRQPLGLRSERIKDHLGRLLSPVLMGELAGLYSITQIVQILGQTSEVEGQFFLTSMAMDEAKHAEVFTRFYHRLEREPLTIRRCPASYLFQSAIMSQDPIEWLTGSLVSEVLAKQTLEDLRELDLDPVFVELCDRILEDEARHLGFNHVFLADRFREAFAKEPRGADETADRLLARLEKVLDHVPPILEGLDKDIRALGQNPDRFFERLRTDTRARLRKSIRVGRDRSGVARLENSAGQ